MALLKTIQEVTTVVSVNINNNFDKILPDIELVEKNILIKYLSLAFYTVVETEYNSVTPSGDYPNLIPRIQKVIVFLALAENIDLSQVQLSDSGLQRIEDETSKTAYKYQKDDVKKYLLRNGWMALESLLEYLEEKKATYPEWASSAAYTINKELLINSAAVFDKFYRIRNSRLVFMELESAIRVVADFSISETIGSDFLTEIQDEIKSANVSTENTTILEKYIQPAVAHLAIAVALGDKVIDITNEGIFSRELAATSGGNEKSMTPKESLLDRAKINAENRGMAYLKKLSEYLNTKASASLYPTYFLSDLYEAPPTTAEEEYNINESNIYPGL